MSVGRQELRIGVIGGTGLYELGGEAAEVNTPHGDVPVSVRREKGRSVFFVARHGKGHGVPAHRVNHKANVAALAACGVSRVFAVNTVGSMRAEWKPGSLVVPRDFVDVSTPATFHDDQAVHVDMTTPYCPQLRQALLKAATRDGGAHEGVYVCTPGPRLETPAEIRWLSTLGDVVGMTGAPEAVLAREKGLCYASLCLVSNLAAGFQKRLPATEVTRNYKRSEGKVHSVLERALDLVPARKTCGCERAPEDARL